MRKRLITFGELLSKLQRDDVLTETGKKITTSNLKKMIENDKIDYYIVDTKSKSLRYFDYDEVYKQLNPSNDFEAEDEFEKMVLEAERLGMQFPQFIKAKETYESYISKQLDNAIKKREHIPIQEAMEAFEISVTNLKSKLYNIPNLYKNKYPKATQEEIDYIYTAIDNAFADIYKAVEKLDE